MLEFLLDRNVSNCELNRIMNLKHDIMSEMARVDSASGILSEDSRHKVGQYVARGVYYKQADAMQVATDV